MVLLDFLFREQNLALRILASPHSPAAAAVTRSRIVAADTHTLMQRDSGRQTLRLRLKGTVNASQEL